MLQVKNLNIYHKKDLRPLVTDLSFTLNDGDRAAIIGEEGLGIPAEPLFRSGLPLC